MQTVKDVIFACNTGLIKGLNQQIIDTMNSIQPNTLVSFADLNVDILGDQIHPYLHAQARAALQRAIAERGVTLIVNSAYRTMAQQYLLRRQFELGLCGIPAAAQPGTSNHESGLALDIEDPYGWQPFLERHQWRHLGAFDPPHFDYLLPSAQQNLGRLSIQAFQRLWNQHNPTDAIAEDGLFGPATAARLEASPIEGFAAQAATVTQTAAQETPIVLQGIDPAQLSTAEQYALDILQHLTPSQFNQIKVTLNLNSPGVLGPTTLAQFLALTQTRGLDLSEAGIIAFKDQHRLGNSGEHRGVIGAQTAAVYYQTLLKTPAAPSTASNGTRKINQAGLNLVKEFEGLADRMSDGRIRAYLDAVGVPTIGYGHTAGVQMGQIITEAQADAFLQDDLGEAEAAVIDLATVPLTDNQFATLVSFVFNLGAGAFASSTLLGELNRQNYSGAADQLLRWVNAGGRQLPGLVRRREAERQLFLSA